MSVEAAVRHLVECADNPLWATIILELPHLLSEASEAACRSQPTATGYLRPLGSHIIF